jgi:hypothetical protein
VVRETETGITGGAESRRPFLLLYEPVSKSEDAHYLLEIKLKKHQSLTP